MSIVIHELFYKGAQVIETQVIGTQRALEATNFAITTNAIKKAKTAKTTGVGIIERVTQIPPGPDSRERTHHVGRLFDINKHNRR